LLGDWRDAIERDNKQQQRGTGERRSKAEKEEQIINNQQIATDSNR
jgi:hypothetical protein